LQIERNFQSIVASPGFDKQKVVTWRRGLGEYVIKLKEKKPTEVKGEQMISFGLFPKA